MRPALALVRRHARIGLLLAAAWLLNACAPWLLRHMVQLGGVESAIAQTLWCLGLFLLGGWACNQAAQGTLLPNFALQLLLGIVLHDALLPLAQQATLAVVVCTALAALILKAGGDEIERRAFLRRAYPTLMLAVLGYAVTLGLTYLLLLGLGLDGRSAALLAAIVGSTDPAALIPTLRQLVLKPPYRPVTDMAVAESALNDAVGAIATASVLALVLAGASLDSPHSLVAGLFQLDNARLLGQQFLFGTLAGVLGWLGMAVFERHKRRHFVPGQADSLHEFALVLGLPLLTFLLAQLIHGNGFLAAFVAGLLGNFNRASPAFHGLVHSLETKIESLAKPTIFMMVGPFVSLQELGRTALLGALVSLLFMLVVRPAAVLLALWPTRVGWREKLFLCAVRETGVIPVVLAVVVVAQLPQLHLLMPLTAWVVVWTLVVLPALTPWWAAKLKMSE